MQQNLIKASFTTSVAIALTIAVFVMALHRAGVNPFGQYKMLFMPLYATVLAIGLWRFRKRQGGWLHGWQGVFFGALTAVFAAAIYGLAIYVLVKYLVPEVLAVHKSSLMEWMKTHRSAIVEHLGEKSYQNNLEGIAHLTARDIAVDEWLKTAAVGFVIGMAMGLAFKKSPPKANT
ncbi:MAG: DUF4199 domain-containing protein [Cytophagales bacterium]|nr:DUF4199 domain-containing protein [Bernardetiaceae bacterium]MDW8210589.1 DUF4199 domain-containing protein [Cytophagales bacterium]